MKNLTCILALIVAVLFFKGTALTLDPSQTVNPILGDISFVSKFGYTPDALTENNLRIRTHLEYIENLLRKKDVSDLSDDLQRKRRNVLDLLHDYWTKGVFPKNYDYADQRKPCFIDKDGNICAVGYLIEQTTSRQTANTINAQYKYEELLAMNDPTVDNWVLTSGLTKKECAMIQPTYQHQPAPLPQNNNYISLEYGMTSFLLGGLNLSLITFNGKQMVRGTRNRAVPVLGVMTGAGQIALGTAMYVKALIPSGGTNDPNLSQKNLSIVNIGLGSATLILSTWNLATRCNPKEKLTSWNVYSFQTQKSGSAFAFSLTRKF